MSDPPREDSAAAPVAGAIASFVFLSMVAPVVVAVYGLLHSLAFFGEQPSAAQRSETAAWLWAAVGIAALSFALIVVLTVVRGERSGRTALLVVSVLALVVLGFWVVVAAAAQPDAVESEGSGSASAPSSAPTIADGRFIPDAAGTAAADTLIRRFASTTFPVDARPDEVQQLLVAAGAPDPEVQGAGGDVSVGIFVGHQTCVLGRVDAGAATWTIAGVSTDGGCLGPHHA